MKRAAAILTLCFCSACPPAAAATIVRHDYVASLNRQTIQSFLEDVEKIANGQRPDLSSGDTADWLDAHLAPDGRFSTVLRYELPDRPAEETTLSLDKESYIKGVVDGQGTMEKYSSTLEIRSIDVSADGRQATLKTVTRENGVLKIPDDETGSMQDVPVEGESGCDQTIILSAANAIQMQGADCRTTIRLDPWKGKKLDEE